MERAHRILPKDDTVVLGLALACLRTGDADAARSLFADLISRVDLLEAWTGLAGSALRVGDLPQAVAAMQAALCRHVVPAIYHSLAAAIAVQAGLPGWCAIAADGRLVADAPASLHLDGCPFKAALDWRRVPGGGGGEA